MRLTRHFGDTPRFILYDTQNERFSSCSCDVNACRGPCHCHIPLVHAGAFDAVICRGIGARALALCRQNQIPVYLTEEADAMQALKAWQATQLVPVERGNCRPDAAAQRHAARMAGQ